MLNPEAMVEKPVKAFAKLLPDKPIWFTEWNVGTEGLAQWKNRGAELQFIAAMFCGLVEQRAAIEIACFHAVYDARFGAFYLDEKSGPGRNERLVRTVPAPRNRTGGRGTVASRVVRDEGFAGFRDTARRRDSTVRVESRRGRPRRDAPRAGGRGAARLTIDCRPERELPRSTPLAVLSAVKDSRVTLPAHSVSLIGVRRTLEIKPKSSEADNLFPRRPDLIALVPPYAGTQPRFDAEGVYTVDLGKFKEKELAVVKMNLASSKLEPEREYQVDFEARVDSEGGLIVKLPSAPAEADAGNTRSGFSSLSREYTPATVHVQV